MNISDLYASELPLGFGFNGCYSLNPLVSDDSVGSTSTVASVFQNAVANSASTPSLDPSLDSDSFSFLSPESADVSKPAELSSASQAAGAAFQQAVGASSSLESHSSSVSSVEEAQVKQRGKGKRKKVKKEDDSDHTPDDKVKSEDSDRDASPKRSRGGQRLNLTSEEKAKRRKIQNRKSAVDSRERKRMAFEDALAKIDEFKKEIAVKDEYLARYAAEYAFIREEYKNFSSIIRGASPHVASGEAEPEVGTVDMIQSLMKQALYWKQQSQVSQF
jgi:hypothetical protein